MARYRFGVDVPPHERWPVAWYNPLVLVRSAQELLSTNSQIRNFDRRELYKDTFEITDLQNESEDGEFWWDFVSDTGDGGNATYTVARAAQSPSLSFSKYGELQRGRLLVLGGDLAYPGASTDEYQYRFTELWEAARPTQDDGRHTVLSIPQNHDWFDNLSTFHRHFTPGFDNQSMNTRAVQKRSYFAARLPHGWWLLGLDFALVGDIDRTQFQAFRRLAQEHIEAGQNVILVYPEPYWTRPLGDEARPGYPKRYQRLEAAMIERGIQIRMRLAGDLHHYARDCATKDADGLVYEDALITCGSGGAFLHPTHTRCVRSQKVMRRKPEGRAMTTDLVDRVLVGNEGAPRPDDRVYKAEKRYPDEKTSRRLVWGNLIAMFRPADEKPPPRSSDAKRASVFKRLTWGNTAFALLLGVLYWLAIFCNAFLFAPSDDSIPFFRRPVEMLYVEFLEAWVRALFYSPLGFTVYAVLAVMCCVIAREDGKWVAIISGLLHAFVHAVAAATIYWGINQYWPAPPVDPSRWAEFTTALLKAATIIAMGTIVGGTVAGLYFAVMSYCRFMTNNAFSPVGHQGYKGFLRFRIDTNGHLHGYMIGTDDVPRRWVVTKAASDAPQQARPVWTEDTGEKEPAWAVRDTFTLKR